MAIICNLCVEKKHKIYWGEMWPEEMEAAGVEYWKCYKCNYSPLIYNSGIGDASCESCGKWQKGKEK